ncbi:molecular chaperone DnaJ [Altericroceibacterium spongiae]|uniref:Molecular chaperone DnaJ n=1 Tax=Altericroceibacterium spongiae TaxID=2320269 RepID=A0A420EIJ9_9SPHN|nr:molecular chaperone DnaJ [Altericroceibacterium spongiae]RKF20539.1 molecular chaperone DnaJ [Altericroceibacterium spongiae]
MTKFLLLSAVIIGAWRAFTGRWIWEYAYLKATTRDEDRARTLLGLHKGASRQDIIDAHRQRIASVHPDRGGSGEQVHATNAARDLLLSRLPAPKEHK